MSESVETPAQPSPPTPDATPPKKKKRDWLGICLFVVLVLPVLLWYCSMLYFMATQVPFGFKAINKQLPILHEALIADAEGENQLHAWVVQMAQQQNEGHWGIDPPNVNYTPPGSGPRPPPVPIPEPLQSLVVSADTTRLIVEGIWAGEKNRRVSVSFYEIDGKYGAYVTLVFSEAYIANPPPDASAYGNALVPEGRGKHRSQTIVPGFEVKVGVNTK